MVQTLVTYFSQTGNTRKIAEAIFSSLENDKEIKPVEEVHDLGKYGLIFIGFPVHSHSVPLKIQNFIKNIQEHQKIAFFSTHGSLTGSRLSREAIEHAVILASKAKVLGTFSCRGKVSMKALEILRRSPEHKAWADMAVSASFHPDEDDLEDARAFASWIKTLSLQH
ncbi:MAG: flavodoxin family protein [Candidatus Aminicenantaceae bacterium]